MSWRPEWEEAPHGRFGFGFGSGSRRSFFSVAPITRTLVLLCIAVTLLSALARNWLDVEDPSRWLALSTDNAPFVYPFFTYVLPHSTYNPLHIVLNMVMLWWLGQELEVRLGPTRYLTLFFGAAVLGAIAHLGLSLFVGARSGLLMGASGGIFALIFFIARESPGRPFFFYFIAIPARVLAIILLVIEVWPIFFGSFSDGVAHACHLAGAAFGYVYRGILSTRSARSAGCARRRASARRPAPPARRPTTTSRWTVCCARSTSRGCRA